MIADVFSWITRLQQRRLALLVVILTILLLAAVVLPEVVYACGQGTSTCHCPGC